MHPLKFATKRSSDRRPFRRFHARLRVEELESRTLLAAYTPAQISTAYGIPVASPDQAILPGAGQTIAIVDAYYDPTIQKDLNAFSTRYGLALLDGQNGDGTFSQVDLSGLGNRNLSPRGDDWTLETALDVEWAHAVAPGANIVLVEAKSDTQNRSTGELTSMDQAVQYAATPTSDGGAGAQVVSMSWGLYELANETKWDSIFTTSLTGQPITGVTFVAASGDTGARTIWPAVSPYVVSVGGTTLNLTPTGTITSETAWSGSGGGVSHYESLPTYQSGLSPSLTQYNARLNPDVAYDANPSTGFSVVNNGRWTTVGGTSAGSPQWAGLIALADQQRAAASPALAPLSSSQTLNALYQNSGDFHDIKTGSTGRETLSTTTRISISAGRGFDLATGLGSPNGSAVLAALTQPITPSNILSGSSSGGSSGSRTNRASNALSPSARATSAVVEVQRNLAGLAASNLSTVQTSLVVTNSPAVLVTPVPVPPVQPGSPLTLAAVPVVVPTPVLVIAGPSVSSRVESGGGGDPLDQDDQPVDDQPLMPAAPVVPPVMPPPARRQVPDSVDPAPDMPNAVDAACLQDESVPGLAQRRELPELPAALLGLVAALAWPWRAQPAQPEPRERRRRRV